MTAIALLGSGEFEPWARPVDTWCAEQATAASERVLVVPTASAPEGNDVFERWGRMGIEHYDAIGLAPEVLELRNRADAQTTGAEFTLNLTCNWRPEASATTSCKRPM